MMICTQRYTLSRGARPNREDLAANSASSRIHTGGACGGRGHYGGAGRIVASRRECGKRSSAEDRVHQQLETIGHGRERL